MMKWILDLFKKIQSVGKREPVVEINYCEKVNQDLEIIKTEYNKACQQAYSILEANKDSEDKEFEWAKDLIRANKTPSFKRIYMDTSLYQIEMDITAEHDAIVIFESMVVKELNKSEVIRQLNYDFTSEDYPDIFIEIKPSAGTKIIYSVHSTGLKP